MLHVSVIIQHIKKGTPITSMPMINYSQVGLPAQLAPSSRKRILPALPGVLPWVSSQDAQVPEEG